MGPDNAYILHAYCELASALSVLHVLFYLIPTTTTFLDNVLQFYRGRKWDTERLKQIAKTK